LGKPGWECRFFNRLTDTRGDTRCRRIRPRVVFTAIAIVKSAHASHRPTGLFLLMIDTNLTVAALLVAKSLYFWFKIASARDLLYQPTIGGSADS